MDVVIIGGAVGFILPAIGLCVVFAKLISRHNTPSTPWDPQTIFSSTRYRPMERLLAEMDRKFIASHPGCTREMERNFRRARVKIFRGYMQQLSSDFNGICKAIKLLIITSKVDRTDLATVVFKAQFQFAVNTWQVELKLFLYGFGWSSVDATSVVRHFDALRTQLQYLMLTAQPSAA
jgi:hypothetical protein